MEIPTLRRTGWILIAGGLFFAIYSFFSPILQLHLNLSASHASLSEFGPAGKDIVMAFGVHIGSLVIALGFLMLGMSKHYHPDIEPYLIAGVISWYVLDCVSSLILGYEYNVIPNTLFLTGFFIVIRSVRQQVKYEQNITT